MDPIGSKTINIQVTDSSLPVPGTPDTGALDVFGGMIDGLSSTPITTILLFALAVAIPMCLIAIIFARLRHNKNSKTAKFSGVLSKITIGLTPVAVALAVMIAPLVNTLAAVEPLNNSAINITIDKAKALTASDTTTIAFGQDASLNASIYASLDSDFNGNLGDSLVVSTANAENPQSTVNLSTTSNLVYTSAGAVAAGDSTEFGITASISENLPVGNYESTIGFYGHYTQETIDVTFWCEANGVSYEPTEGIVEINIDDYTYLVGKTISLEVGSDYELPSIEEIGLGDSFCYSASGPGKWMPTRPVDFALGYNQAVGTETLLWPKDDLYRAEVGSSVKAHKTLPFNSLEPSPSLTALMPLPYDPEIMRECVLYMLNGSFIDIDNECYQYKFSFLSWVTTTIINWMYNTEHYDTWLTTDEGVNYMDNYRTWREDWDNWLSDNPRPVFDGMDLIWRMTES